MIKTENVQERTLRFVHNDCTSDYRTLLNKSNKSTMKVRRLRVLALEVSYSINKLNSVQIQSLFEENVNFRIDKDGLKIPILNLFRDKNVRILGFQI